MGNKTLWVIKKGSGDDRSYVKLRYMDFDDTSVAAPPDDPDFPLEFTGVTDEAHIFKTYDAAYVFRMLAKLHLFDVVGVNIIVGDYQ